MFGERWSDLDKYDKYLLKRLCEYVIMWDSVSSMLKHSIIMIECFNVECYDVYYLLMLVFANWRCVVELLQYLYL